MRPNKSNKSKVQQAAMEDLEKISSVFWNKKNIDKKASVEEKKLIQAKSEAGSKQEGRVEKREEKRLVEAMTINKKKKSITYNIKAYFQGELTTEKKKMIFECLLLIHLNRIESFSSFSSVFFQFSLFLFRRYTALCCCCCFFAGLPANWWLCVLYVVSERTKKVHV